MGSENKCEMCLIWQRLAWSPIMCAFKNPFANRHTYSGSRNKKRSHQFWLELSKMKSFVSKFYLQIFSFNTRINGRQSVGLLRSFLDLTCLVLTTWWLLSVFAIEFCLFPVQLVSAHARFQVVTPLLVLYLRFVFQRRFFWAVGRKMK